MATIVAAAQEGPEETMRKALAASSAKEASAASDAGWSRRTRWVERNWCC